MRLSGAFADMAALSTEDHPTRTKVALDQALLLGAAGAAALGQLARALDRRLQTDADSRAASAAQTDAVLTANTSVTARADEGEDDSVVAVDATAATAGEDAATDTADPGLDDGEASSRRRARRRA